MAHTSLPLLQGTLDLLVLKALEEGPMHGYGVARWIRETSDLTLEIEDGALYTALHRLEKRRWVESEWGLSENNRRARYYRLTREGGRQLEREERTWVRYAAAVARLLRAREA